MNTYAVIKINSKQYLVEPGQTYTVEKFVAEEGSKVTPEVLLTSIDGKLNVGKPLVDGAKVQIEVLEQGKGEKVQTFTYTAKTRRDRKVGFRKRVTTFKVIDIK